MQEKKKPKISAAWLSPEYDISDVIALKALEAGTATERQQKQALKWIVEKASRYYSLGWMPGGHEGARESDFFSGRRFVGFEIVKLLKLDLSILKEK